MRDADRFRGCLLGLAAGDAVGTAVEFSPRGTFSPVTDLVGGGPFGLKAGQWTDDTSMAMCLAASLVEKGGFDAHDQMDRYDRWAKEGYMSSTGTCFDVGTTVAMALRSYRQSGDPWAGTSDPKSAGNGAIMRLAPIPMFFYPDLDKVERMAADSSRTTHGCAESVDACRLLARILCRLLAGTSKDPALFVDATSFQGSEKIAAIACGAYRSKREAEVRGTGYVADSLEAALWCFYQTDTFEKAILSAANLGDDADTTAAVCGQVAGAFYGESGIPAGWLKKLHHAHSIRKLADMLCVGPTA